MSNDNVMISKTPTPPKMAICYDFDKTLSPDDMQSFTLIPSFGIQASDFWKESNKRAMDKRMDKNLAWMYELTRHSVFNGKSLKREYFNAIGADVPLYKGVETWFGRMDSYAKAKGIGLQHYIISSGLKEIIEGSPIASNFEHIYASSYMYDADGVAVWPAQAVNYTNKTQYIFRIAKGIPEEYDERVNDSMDKSMLAIPYENIVYIGDSETDIPCMRLVKSKGGYSIGVFDPEKDNRRKVYQLYNDGRINFYAPADYTEGKDLARYVMEIIDAIAAQEKMKAEQESLKRDADWYQLYRMIENQEGYLPESAKPRLEKLRNSLKEYINGKIE